jgi:Tfp pilus assembly protein PilF
MTLGSLYLARNQIELARQAFTDAIAADPRRVDAQLELAKLHLELASPAESIRYAEAGVRLDPSDVDARLTLVRVLSQQPSELPRARAEIERLIKEQPQSADAYSAAGVVALRANDRGAARQYFEKALAIDAVHLEALSGITAVDAESGRLAEARARLDARLSGIEKPGADLMLLAAKVYVTSGQPDDAERVLRRIVTEDPTNLEGYNLLGQFYVARRQLDAAVREYEQVTTRQPSSVTAHTMLGLLAHATGNVDAARKGYEGALRVDPKAAVAANNLAWLYATSNSRLDVAKELAEVARSQSPDSADFADTLGFVHFQRGDYEIALPLFRDAVSKRGDNPQFRYHLGLTFAKLGQDASAREQFKAALSLNPQFEEAEDAKRAMAALLY